MYFPTFVIVGVLVVGLTFGVPLSPAAETRIIGGEDAPIAYSPHMVALIMDGPHPAPICGGSIISTSLVLTAAHCIDAVVLANGQLSQLFYLRVGSNKWNSGGTVVQVKTYHNHPQWDPAQIKYDAGILVLEEKLVLSDVVAVVQLNFDYVEGNEKTVVTGWGRTGLRIDGHIVHLQPTPEDLQILYQQTITHEQCELQMKQVAEGRWTPPIDEEVEICTFHSRGHGMCVGDSGSALMLQDTKELIGVVSWGFGCAQGAPDVFFRVSGVRQFLQTLMDVYKD